MRCIMLCCVILTFGCGKEEGTTRIGKATQLINATGTPKSAEIMVFGDDGWSDWAALNEEHRAKVLALFSECIVVRKHYNKGELSQPPPPYWIVRFGFENEPERKVEFRGGLNSFITVDMGDSSVLLDTEDQQEELVELLESFEK